MILVILSIFVFISLILQLYSILQYHNPVHVLEKETVMNLWIKIENIHLLGIRKIPVHFREH